MTQAIGSLPSDSLVSGRREPGWHGKAETQTEADAGWLCSYAAQKQQEQFMGCKHSHRDRAVARKAGGHRHFCLSFQLCMQTVQFPKALNLPQPLEKSLWVPWNPNVGRDTRYQVLAMTPQYQNEPQPNCPAQHQVKALMFSLSFSFVTIPKSTRHLPSACHVLSPVRNMVVREKKKQKPYSLLSGSPLTSPFGSSTSQHIHIYIHM